MDPEKRKKYDQKQQKIGAFESKERKEQRSSRNSESPYRDSESSYGYSETPGRKYETPFGKTAFVGFILFFMIFGGWILVHGNEESPSSLNPEITVEKPPEIAEIFAETGEIFTETVEKPPETYTNSIGMEFVQVPAGEFVMGSFEDEEDKSNYENPIHKVTIEKPYYLGKYEVTQKQWRKVMGDNPSNFQGNTLPVEQVSWYDAQEFIKKLNRIEDTDKYRLPSEAEWEYACRAGNSTKYSFGDDESQLYAYAWYNRNSVLKTHPVGQKKPNAWGLYDMHGNVWEWVAWHDDYPDADSSGNEWEQESESFRTGRGGGWSSNAKLCQSTICYDFNPDYCGYNLGFRILREI